MPTETGRHRLYEKIKEQWGEEHATELMSYLPPVGWADVATKQDLDTQTALLRAEMTKQRSDLGTEIAGLRIEIAELCTAQATELRNHLYWIIGTMIGLTGLVSIIVGWLG